MLRFLKRSILQRSIIAALIVFLMAPPLAADEWPHPGTRSQVSGKSFAELVTALNTAIKNNGMFAVTKASASAGAKRRGIDIAGNMPSACWPPASKPAWKRRSASTSPANQTAAPA